MIKIILTLATIAVPLALSSQYLRRVETDFLQQLLHASEQAETTHIFSQFSLSSTDETGNIESLLKSPNTRYIVNEQKTHLTSPTMLVYRNKRAPVKLSAESAIIDHPTNTTTLHDNVEVSIDENSTKPLRLTTDLLVIDNTNQVANTTSSARIYYGSSRMDGTGLELDMEQKKVKFLDKVHGVYEH